MNHNVSSARNHPTAPTVAANCKTGPARLDLCRKQLHWVICELEATVGIGPAFAANIHILHAYEEIRVLERAACLCQQAPAATAAIPETGQELFNASQTDIDSAWRLSGAVARGQ
jgi:hypothetical protein